jgi:hypothetical protein
MAVHSEPGNLRVTGVAKATAWALTFPDAKAANAFCSAVSVLARYVVCGAELIQLAKHPWTADVHRCRMQSVFAHLAVTPHDLRLTRKRTRLARSSIFTTTGSLRSSRTCCRTWCGRGRTSGR